MRLNWIAGCIGIFAGAFVGFVIHRLSGVPALWYIGGGAVTGFLVGLFEDS